MIDKTNIGKVFLTLHLALMLVLAPVVSITSQQTGNHSSHHQAAWQQSHQQAHQPSAENLVDANDNQTECTDHAACNKLCCQSCSIDNAGIVTIHQPAVLLSPQLDTRKLFVQPAIDPNLPYRPPV